MAVTTNKYLYSDDGGNSKNAAKSGVTGGATALTAGAIGSINKAGAKTTGGGGSTSTGGGGGKVDVEDYGYQDNGFDLAAYYAELQRQAQARANAAYERNMERIANAYGSAYNSLTGNYDSTVSRLNAARDKSIGDVNNDAEKSLREAYINKMLTEKNLNQRLSAMGYNGGATETSMAQLANNYGNSRTGINETLNNNLSNLNMTYGDNLAAALQSFNSAKANLDLQRMQLEMQAENARNNALDSSMSASFGMDSGYLSALQNALKNQSAYQYDASKATNDFVAGNAQQGQNASEGANYSKYLAQLQLGASQGKSMNQLQNEIFSAVSKGDLDLNAAYRLISSLTSR